MSTTTLVVLVVSLFAFAFGFAVLADITYENGYAITAIIAGTYSMVFACGCVGVVCVTVAAWADVVADDKRARRKGRAS